MNMYSYVSVLCYDNEGEAGAGTGNAETTNNQTPPATPTTPPATPTTPPTGEGSKEDERKFTQTELNTYLAEDKRKHQERYAQLETEFKALSENINLTQEDRDKYKARVDELQKLQRTREQQLEYDKQQMEDQLKQQLDSANERGDHWENLYKETEIERSLADAAAAGEAFNPQQIVVFLKPYTSLKDVEGVLKPMVDFPDIDDKTGEPTVTLRTPEEAVKRMREQRQLHGNYFRTNVVSGVGAGSGETPGPTDYDYSGMSTDDYMKNRKRVKESLNQN